MLPGKGIKTYHKMTRFSAKLAVTKKLYIKHLSMFTWCNIKLSNMCNIKKFLMPLVVLHWMQVTSCDKIYDTAITKEKTY